MNEAECVDLILCVIVVTKNDVGLTNPNPCKVIKFVTKLQKKSEVIVGSTELLAGK